MKVCRVIGTAVSTIKLDGLTGHKLLLLQELEPNQTKCGNTILAIDTVGASLNDVVAVCEGTSVLKIENLSNIPIDAAVIGILDSIKLQEKELDFSKN